MDPFARVAWCKMNFPTWHAHPWRILLLLACAVAGTACQRPARGTIATVASAPGEPASCGPSGARIVCGSPAVTEIVFALGCGNAVVGVSDFVTAPGEARAKERVGGLLNPNRERLTALRPDIIITQGRHEALETFAVERGIRFHTVRLETLADLYAAIASIASVLGISEKGAALAESVRADLFELKRQTAALPRRSVLLVVGRSPGNLGALTTVGPGTFLGDLLTMAGGRSVFGDAKGPYPQVSKESVVARRPEVILEVNTDLPADAVARLRDDWRQLDDIPAVRHDRIVCLSEDFLLVPGPRVGMAARALADAIHQMRFPPGGAPSP